MSVSISAAPNHQEVARSTADFPPGFGAHSFLTYTSHDTVINECKKQQIEELKEEVREELKKARAVKSPDQLLKLIDSIQLLAVAYHFEREIEEALKDIHETYSPVDDNEDLTTSSLRFRLLRQEGYHVPSDLFNKFKDEEGNFKESLIADSPGLLALYEASYLMVHGEDILEEALAFTTTHLKSIATDSNNPLAKQAIHALKRPIRKGMTRVDARHYISTYQEEGSCNKSLLMLAKLDFNLLQALHMKEISEISKWWKGLEFETKLPFARERVAETYFWGLGVYFEPQYLLGLRLFTKVATLLTVADDIYDAYGTIEELELLTEAVERWDVSCIDQLPADYLKFFYQALLDVYEEIEEEMAKQGKSYRVFYAKEAMKRQIQAYFGEAKWLSQGYEPTFEEYLKEALVSSGHTLLIAISFVGMGDVATEEAFQWLLNRNKMIRASEFIGRVMNDIVAHEFEQSRMHIPSSVECYMKQYRVTKQEAYDELNKQIEKAWKDINQECLKPTQLPMTVTIRALNFTCVEDIMYKDGDEYTHVGKLLKDLIALMLVDPVPI